MATYIVSDIHGCYTAFMNLLDKSGYVAGADELIIAGDIIDRGPENYQMLEYAASKPKNVIFLMGNHDYNFIEYCKALLKLYSTKKVSSDIDLHTLVHSYDYRFMFKNNVIDHYDTIRNLVDDESITVTLNDFKRWKNIISKFPFYVERMIDDKHYIIVHAGYIEKKVYEKAKISLLMRGMGSIEKFYIWAREEAIYEGGLSGATIISGHTPTIADAIFYNDGRISKIKHNGCKFIDIDCGYVFKNIDKHANLACFKLDDETVTYLE